MNEDINLGLDLMEYLLDDLEDVGSVYGFLNIKFVLILYLLFFIFECLMLYFKCEIWCSFGKNIINVISVVYVRMLM